MTAMSTDPADHTLVLVREIRASIDLLRTDLTTRLDRLDVEVAEVRGEVRETRTALNGFAYAVNLSLGDIKAQMENVVERLDRLERERA